MAERMIRTVGRAFRHRLRTGTGLAALGAATAIPNQSKMVVDNRLQPATFTLQ